MVTVRAKLARVAVAAVIGSLGLVGLGAGGTEAATTTGGSAAGQVQPAVVPGYQHTIKNFFSQQCLQPTDAVEAAPIIQSTCNGSALQNWQFVSKSGTHYMFINQAISYCLYANGGLADGTPLKVDSCNDSNAEWNGTVTLNRTTGQDVFLSSREHFQDSSFCLALTNVGIMLQGCTGTAGQEWVFPGE